MDYNKLIEDKNECIDHCYKDKIYKFEFDNKCYKDCPNNTLNSSYFCENISQTYFMTDTILKINTIKYDNINSNFLTYLIKDESFTTNISEYIPDKSDTINIINFNPSIRSSIIHSTVSPYISSFFNPYISSEIINNTMSPTTSSFINNSINPSIINKQVIHTIIPSDAITNMNIIIKNKTEFVHNIIEEIKNINISNLDNGNDIEIKQDNLVIALTTTETQKNNEYIKKTVINLGECEYKLKKVYNISINSSLYILKIEIKEEGMRIPKIEYEVYYPLYNKGLIKLNLSYCKETKISLSIPVIINDNIEKYNTSSDYYNDICSKTTSESGTDLSLKDRKQIFINKNMTLCEEDCDLIDYNYTTKKAKCSCKIKINLPLIDDIKIDKERLFNSFSDLKNIANLYFNEML